MEFVAVDHIFPEWDIWSGVLCGTREQRVAVIRAWHMGFGVYKPHFSGVEHWVTCVVRDEGAACGMG